MSFGFIAFLHSGGHWFGLSVSFGGGEGPALLCSPDRESNNLALFRRQNSMKTDSGMNRRIGFGRQSCTAPKTIRIHSSLRRAERTTTAGLAMTCSAVNLLISTR